MKKRLFISGVLTLVLTIAPFFLVRIEVKPVIGNSSIAQNNSYDSIKNINDNQYRDVYKEMLDIHRNNRFKNQLDDE